MSNFINDIYKSKDCSNIIFVVYHITETRTALKEITRNVNRLVKYDNSKYHMVFRCVYKGKFVYLNEHRLISFKSLIQQQLTYFNRKFDECGWFCNYGIDINKETK
jgi:hypothetical protein